MGSCQIILVKSSDTIVTELEGDVRSVSLYNLCAQTSDSPYSLPYSA